MSMMEVCGVSGVWGRGGVDFLWGGANTKY